MKSLDDALLAFLDSPWNVVGAGAAALLLVLLALSWARVTFYLRFICKSLLRNLLRTTLTALATVVLVFVVTMVWTVLYFLDLVTTEKTKDLKAIVTERWQIPSQMPMSYAVDLARNGATRDEDVKVQDSMTWQFFGGTLDPNKRTRDNIVFFFGMEPGKLMSAVGLTSEETRQLATLQEERRRLALAVSGAHSEQEKAERSRQLSLWDGSPGKGGRVVAFLARRSTTEKELQGFVEPVVKRLLLGQPPEHGDVERVSDFLGKRCSYSSMMDGIDELSARQQMELYLACEAMARDRRKVILGRERLAAIKKKVGERFTVTGLNYPGIDLEVEVLGTFPPGRYDQSALMNRDYISAALDAYKVNHKGTEHFMATKTLNLVWLRVPDSETFREVAEDISNSPKFKNPAVKTETASSGVAAFLDAYRDLLWGMRWLMGPAILVTMALVIANAISISVRERRTEIAVLKVLGFSPTQVMVFILGEALLIGCGSGLLSAGGTYLFINGFIGGIKFPIAFFPAFKIPLAALWWGPMIGGLTGLAGSIFPAWTARSVKVSEVFSKIS